MPVLLLAALLLQSQAPARPDTARRGPRRQAVTDAHLATAFRDGTARALLLRARAARLQQDSALLAYDATAYMRISAGMGFARIGRDRLIFRTENVARVRWQRGVGAYVDVKGARTAIPVAPPEAQKEAQEDIADDMDVPIPYYPGHESLWVGGGMARAKVDERELIHPIAEGSEAYYMYETGDSVSFRLPSGTTVRLRELRVRPRRPRFNAVVGSFWFDTRSGQLVRAAYRLATPLDVWTVVKEDDPKADQDIPWAVKGLISPMKAELSAAAVEYGLYEGRFWLPRLQSAEGSAQVSFMRVPFRMEQSFRYASVNGRDTLPAVLLAGRTPLESRLDSLPEPERRRVVDSLAQARRALRQARRDSVKRGLLPDSVLRVTPAQLARKRQCDTSEYTTRRRTTRDRDGANESLRVAYRVPCDVAKLATAPELPASIFDANEEVFGSKERDELIRQALSMTAQPAWAPQPPVVHWGMDLLRYNRVEGLSAGLSVEQKFGAGYTGRALGRIGTGDGQPGVELTMERSNMTRTLHVTGYNRLVAANDWGNPLSFGSSLSALLFGRDEGFYYRASGAEVGATRDAAFASGGHLSWRLFAEQERNAALGTTWSLGARFIPNVTARRATFLGGAARFDHSYGLDPKGLRVLSGLRLEAARPVRDADRSSQGRYARAAADLTLSHGLGGDILGALALSGGSSAGDLPPQRRWFLGGAQTIRGERPDTAASGNAYWLTQAELGREQMGVRTILFGDLGWTGDRRSLGERALGRPMSSVGIGTSFLDGLVRLDLARGIYPRKQWRASMYVEAKM